MRGVVTRVFPDEGNGFVEADGQEFFVHANTLLGTDFGALAPGVPVVFEVEEHAQGDLPTEQPRAVEVRLAADAIPAVDNTNLPRRKVEP